jgi:hypothetical protein
VILIVSTRQPGAPIPESLPRRQRSTTLWPAAAGGRIATEVMKPFCELPVQASRPDSGFPRPVWSVPL